MALSDFDDLLSADVEGKAPRLKTKSEILEYFHGNTRQAAEYGIKQGVFVNRNGEPIKLASAMRRFQSRGGKSQGENAPAYQALGQTLPPQIKGNQLTVTIKGDQDMGDGGTRPRSFTYTFKGKEAQAFAENPSYAAFFYKLGYPQEVIEKFEDGTYKLTITSVS